MRPSPHKPLGRGWWPLLIAAGAYAILITITVAVRTAGVSPHDSFAIVKEKTTSDFLDFWWTAHQFRETGTLSTDFGVHNYLPFFTIFMLPWSFLPLPVAAVLFSLLSLGLFAVTAALTESLLRDTPGERPRAALLIALGLSLPYVHSCLVVGNVGLLLAFLIVATWFLVERGHEWEAGAALGLAVLIKLLPVILVLFFLLKRRWRVAGGAAIVSVVLGFGLPLLMLGYPETSATHQSFYERAFAGGSAHETITAEKPIKAKYSNNSLPIVLRRLLSHTDAAPGSTNSLYVNIADLPRGIIFVIYAILVFGFVSLSTAAALRPFPPWPPDGIDAGHALRAQFGVWCCLMLLASPLVWTHYLSLAFWPLAYLADRADRTRRATGHPGWTNAAALLIWLAGAVLLAWPAARAVGMQLASVACLWTICLLATFGPRRQPTAPRT